MLRSSLLGKDHCDGKDSNRKHELYSDAEPIKLHIKDFLSKAAQHVVDADIPVGWQELCCAKNRVWKHRLWYKDATEKCHAKTNDISQYIHSIIIWCKAAYQQCSGYDEQQKYEAVEYCISGICL